MPAMRISLHVSPIPRSRAHRRLAMMLGHEWARICLVPYGESLARRCLDLGDAVKGPGGFVGRGYGGGIGEGIPCEPAETIGKPVDGVPGTVGCCCDPELQPAVPREVLELHGAQEHWRAQSFERVVGDVLDARGVLEVEGLALDCISRNDGTTP